MGGKAAVLLVLGFSLIFMVAGHNFGNLSNRSVDNLTTYYMASNAHNVAVSGANMAASNIFFDRNWSAGYTNLAFNNGIINVSVTSSGTNKIVTSVGSYGDHTDTVKIILDPSYFSKFGNFYKSMSAIPATGDTFNGPFHCNGTFYTYGTPVFWGKTTAKGSLKKYGVPKDPKFYGGFETGVDIPLEFDTSGMRFEADAAGKVFKDTAGMGRRIDVNLEFKSNGNVEYSYMINNDGTWTAPVDTPLNSLANNGVIFVEKGNINVKGTLNGQATIVASKKGKSGCGNIYQLDDVKYNNDPRVDPTSTDMLGMVAEEYIRLKNSPATIGRDIITQASMFSKNGNIGPDDGLWHQPTLHSWRILGGLIAKNIRVTADYGMVGGISVPINGLKFVHDYDERFMTMVPPKFPHTRFYEIVSWYE
jgi:hypothetical protein